ncbi:MAG TPA: hypothetical protein VER97_15305 [Geodermatophilus sp.]|nr:hypothetical protein [Geodermatophilus sp.]
MGRHAAADGAGTDPIVAAALAQQDSGSALRHATDTTDATDATDDPATESGLGWPGDTTTGGGLGWPGSLDTAGGDTADGDTADGDEGRGDATADETSRMDAVPAVPGPRGSPEDGAEEGAGPPARRGWRWMFGGTAA